MMLRHTRLLLWRLGASVALALGLIGILVPVLPTVPFLILAAWAASKGWPPLERWLLEHRTYGPPIRRWRERGSVPRKAKWLATGMMGVSAVALQLSSVHLGARIGAPVLMLFVAIWLWKRPED